MRLYQYKVVWSVKRDMYVCCICFAGREVCVFFFFLMIRRPPRSTQSRSSASSDVYKRQYLQWQGDASFVAHDNFAALETIFQNEAIALQHQAQQLNKPWAGLLYGYVDLKPVPISHWCLIA